MKSRGNFEEDILYPIDMDAILADYRAQRDEMQPKMDVMAYWCDELKNIIQAGRLPKEKMDEVYNFLSNLQQYR